MNIGLLTYHWVPNFGANLQALSTYSYIENAGHTPVILNWIPEDLEKDYQKKVQKEQVNAHKEFAKLHFKSITPICRTAIEVAKAIDEYDIDLVVIGSDAVFTMVPFMKRFHLSKRSFIKYEKPFQDSRFPNPYWGNFLDYVRHPVKVAGLSVSAQNTHFKAIIERKKEMRDSLSHFSYLSVRDVWTQKMVSFLTQKKEVPTITPDPVFAFEQNVHYEGYKNKLYSSLGKYVLISLTPPNYNEKWILELENLFNSAGVKLIGLPQTNKSFRSPLKENLSFPIDPLDWYQLIKNSQGYIGELMHPVLVSLHNAVPVFVFDKYGFTLKGLFDESSSKTYQIMNRFNLLDNYYNAKQTFKLPNPKIVFDRIVFFDKECCRSTAIALLKKYNEMMTNIISL